MAAEEIILSPLSVLDTPSEEQLTRRERVISGLPSLVLVCMSASMAGPYYCQSAMECDLGSARKISPLLLFQTALVLSPSWFLIGGSICSYQTNVSGTLS